jgi:hypothetical protein
MNISGLYRSLLRLYPADFREQFSQEMCSVFERRAAERSGKGKVAASAFVLREFVNVVKTACAMRMPRRDDSEIAAASSTPPRNLEEAAEQRAQAIRKMVVCIGKHEFAQARRYSYEEVRLQKLVGQFQSNVPAESGGTA